MTRHFRAGALDSATGFTIALTAMRAASGKKKARLRGRALMARAGPADYASKYCANSKAVGRRREGLISFSSFHQSQVSMISLVKTSPLSKKA